MIKGGKGGSKTKSGLYFEERVDFGALLNSHEKYNVKDNENYYGGINVGRLMKKHKFYSDLLIPNGVNYKTIISKKMLPDEAIYVYDLKRVHVLEMKFQNIGGSVDEKLQTCDFKLKQYKKLLEPLGIEVSYTYILSDWFKADSYRDVLEYIKAVGCNYFFNEIPLAYLDLPN